MKKLKGNRKYGPPAPRRRASSNASHLLPCEVLTLSNLHLEAARLGGHVEDDSAGDWKTYQCIAPAGHVWSASGTHLLCVSWDRFIVAERERVIADAVDRMRHGTQLCDDAQCDVCHSEES